MKKYVKNIKCCGECPEYRRMNPEFPRCIAATEIWQGFEVARIICIDVSMEIPEWCPLPDSEGEYGYGKL